MKICYKVICQFTQFLNFAGFNKCRDKLQFVSTKLQNVRWSASVASRPSNLKFLFAEGEKFAGFYFLVSNKFKK